MEQRLLDFLHGYVRIRITGPSCERFLNLCVHRGIRLWRVTAADGVCEACLTKADFFRLKEIVRKSRAGVRVMRRYGFPFMLRTCRKRGACLCGVLCAALLMAWLSAHIWSITIEGNLSQTDDVIFEYLEGEGISHGIWKNQVDTQELSEGIRNYFSRFSWVSTQLKGTRLTIYVKEGTSDSAESDTNGTDAAESMQGGGLSEGEKICSGIAAAKSGEVVSVYVRKGLAAVSAGDLVEEGDLLVSGRIPVYNDEGEITAWQEAEADADVILRTETSYYDELDYERTVKNYTGNETVRHMLRLGSSSFALPGTLKGYDLCDITVEITQSKVSENFYLPIWFYEYTVREYENLTIHVSKEEACENLRDNLSSFIEKLQEKGVQIFQNNVTIEARENSAAAQGILITDESAVVRVTEEEELQE
ncbi:MAG: sporulation protein YqfD [Clostridiales bacterium]|nr:sporulation protein YqfD [Clostridiales bacterium]